MLSVIFGNAKYEMFEVAADWLYQLDLFKAEQAFWSAVLSGEPPVAMEAPPAPRPVATRELSFEGNNAWASAAADWLETGKAAKTHATCLQDPQGAARRRCQPRLRPRHRGEAQQGWRDHHPGTQMSAPQVYKAITAISAELSGGGIAKRHRNERDDYRYRSIDDVLNRLSPLLAKHKLCVLPRVLERTSADRLGDGDLLLVGVTLRIAFDLVSSADGSSHTVEAFGEALDASDKATAKAMSSAYKQRCSRRSACR